MPRWGYFEEPKPPVPRWLVWLHWSNSAISRRKGALGDQGKRTVSEAKIGWVCNPVARTRRFCVLWIQSNSKITMRRCDRDKRFLQYSRGRNNLKESDGIKKWLKERWSAAEVTGLQRRDEHHPFPQACVNKCYNTRWQGHLRSININ